MSDDNGLAERDQRITELTREIAVSRVSRETGVLPELLVNGQTVEEIERIAADALAWKLEGQPVKPPTAAVSASVVTSADRIAMPHQITTTDELRRMSPAERMRAYREGRLTHLGANPPQPRRIGLSGAPTNRVPR